MLPEKTILITGATGNIGGKLREHFTKLGWKLILIDKKNEAHDSEVVGADLSHYDEEWAQLFKGVDAVIHLAADANPGAKWDSIFPNNVVATQNVMRAAVENKVPRVIFASSNWVMAGYQFTAPQKLTTALPPKPVNAYGLSKQLGEQIGREASGCPSFIALRLGYCQPGDNEPGPGMYLGSWGQRSWLSNEDLCQGVQKAVLAPAGTNAVLNLMSNNENMRWDIAHTKDVIGYAPQRSHTTIFTDKVRGEDRDARKEFMQSQGSHLPGL